MTRKHRRGTLAAFATAALLVSVVPVAPGTASPGSAGPPGTATFEVEEATIADIRAAFADGTLDCVGLTRLYLERIAAYDDAGPAINAVATINPEALATAARLDEEYERHGPRSRLHCIPVLLKDNIDTYDMPTTNGSVILKDAVPPDDAFITARLRAQGALILGKAEMGEFAGGSYNTIDGQVLNPYNLKRGTGGSSAGSGAAIAANFAVLAVGTDTSTSVRGPAAYNGIVGLRPTTGLVSRDGIAPKNLTFDSAGPMARTVTDTALMMNALTGKDSADPLTLEVYRNHPDVGSRDAGIDYTQHLRSDALEGKRLGVVRDFFGGDPEIEAMAAKALKTLEAQGATLVDVNLDPEFLDTYVTRGGEIRTIADYRFKEEFEDYLSTFGPEVPKTVEEFIEIYERDVNRSPLPVEDSVLNLLKRSLTTSKEDPKFKDLIERVLPAATEYKLSLFEDHRLDALVFPYQTSFASPIKNPVQTVADPTYVSSAVPQPSIFAGYSSVGFPGIVVPMGSGSQGLPMDISFMGKPYSEGDLFGYAYDYEQASQLRAPSPLVPSLSEGAEVTPTRAVPKLSASVGPRTVIAGRTRPRVLVRLTGANGVVKGRVVLRAAGRTYRATLANGRARIRLAAFGKPGRKTVTVRFLGTGKYKPTSERISVRVRRR